MSKRYLMSQVYQCSNLKIAVKSYYMVHTAAKPKPAKGDDDFKGELSFGTFVLEEQIDRFHYKKSVYPNVILFSNTISVSLRCVIYKSNTPLSLTRMGYK